MEELLKAANELGLLIKNTEAAKAFHQLNSLVESRPESLSLLKKYNEIAETVYMKQESGYEIEAFEARNFKELTEKVLSDELLGRYIKARDGYMDMLMKINAELTRDMPC